ncbi:RNA polymerase sigma factor [Streptomyces sp. NPDC088733]|uniref:RNA polymerase sigma factor n=1 Tax=Streptomyces sp. NPDC088733 TaxID=3365880 RepID=UPI00382278B8
MTSAERRKAMEDFYRVRHPRLLAYVAKRVDGRLNAEDVCQEIWRRFFAIFDAVLADYEEPGQALYGIARNYIPEFWRSRPGRHETATEDGDLAALRMLAEAVQPELALNAALSQLDVEKALATLPRRQRQALFHRYTEDLTVPTTAVEMGISENTVKKLLKTAMATLRGLPALQSYRPEAMSQEVRK